MSKRFTEAELSAELFRQVFIEAEMEVRGRKSGDPKWIEPQREEARRSMVVERFALSPDHDEPEGEL